MTNFEVAFEKKRQSSMTTVTTTRQDKITKQLENNPIKRFCI